MDARSSSPPRSMMICGPVGSADVVLSVSKLASCNLRVNLMPPCY
jgi:hypothetical protein